MVESCFICKNLNAKSRIIRIYPGRDIFHYYLLLFFCCNNFQYIHISHSFPPNYNRDFQF